MKKKKKLSEDTVLPELFIYIARHYFLYFFLVYYSFKATIFLFFNFIKKFFRDILELGSDSTTAPLYTDVRMDTRTAHMRAFVYVFFFFLKYGCGRS